MHFHGTVVNYLSDDTMAVTQCLKASDRGLEVLAGDFGCDREITNHGFSVGNYYNGVF